QGLNAKVDQTSSAEATRLRNLEQRNVALGEALFERDVALFQITEARGLSGGGLVHLGVEALDRGERYAIGVYGGDVPVVGSEPEGGVEILRHGSEMAAAFLVVTVVPLIDR